MADKFGRAGERRNAIVVDEYLDGEQLMNMFSHRSWTGQSKRPRSGKCTAMAGFMSARATNLS